MLGWLEWTHLWPFAPVCVLGDFRQFGHWVLTSISCCMRDISFSFSFRVLASLSLLRILCRFDRSVYLCSWKNRNCYMTDILSSRYWTTDNQNDLLGIVLSLPQEWKCLFFLWDLQRSDEHIHDNHSYRKLCSLYEDMQTCRLSYHTVNVDHVSVRGMYLHQGLKWDFIREHRQH